MGGGKARIEDLALFGGPPEFPLPLHVGAPNIGDRKRLMERVGEALDRRWLSNNGPFVREFEARLQELLGVEHCVAVSSGEIALQMAIRAAGLSGEVIVPSFTFIGTPHAVLWEGLTPVFCEIDPQTYNIDPARAEALITERTSAILGVHVWGRACDVAALEKIAKAHGLKLLFDAAHAFGCTYEGAMIGGFGQAEMFSFHATKCVNTFEGGAIATRDSEFAQRLRLMRSFGFADIDRVEAVGINGKLNEISAAMGLSSLEAMNDFVRANREHYAQYRRELSSVPGIAVVAYDEGETSTYQFVVIEIDAARLGLTRDELQEVLWSENVLARRYFFPPCHLSKPYREMPAYANLRLPVTEALSARVLSLPNGTAVTSSDVERLCAVIRFAGENAASITARKGRIAVRGAAS